MARLERSAKQHRPEFTLPLTGLNHISFAVPFPKETARFFETLLGFKSLKRPDAIDNICTGAWIRGMGLEIHFVQPEFDSPRNQHRAVPLNKNCMYNSDLPIDTRSDHLAFLCTSGDEEGSAWNRIIDILTEWGVQYEERCYPEDNIKQLFFCEPTSGILIEVGTNP